VSRSLYSKRVAVLATGRQDWGILRSMCLALQGQLRLHLAIAAGGMHLSLAHRRTINAVRGGGLEPHELATWLPDRDDSPEPPSDNQAASTLSSVGAWLRATRADAPVAGWRPAGDRRRGPRSNALSSADRPHSRWRRPSAPSKPFIGLGAAVRDHVTVGAGAMVGTGAAVVGDVPSGAVVTGAPARG
jgi:hypothetical protein